MRRLLSLVLVLALPGQLAFAEAGASAPAAPATAAPAVPLPAALASVASPLTAAEVRAALDQVQSVMRAQSRQLEDQRKQIERQQSEIEELRRQVGGGKPAAGVIPEDSTAEQEQAAASTEALLNSQVHALKAASTLVPAAEPVSRPAATAPVGAQQGSGTESADAPLSIHFGNGSLTPGGWVDFTSYFRSTDVGSGLGTSFGSIPYNNTVAGGLSETRFTAQSSRISLRADEVFGNT